MRGVIKKLHITVGLPASGKTTWANEYRNNSRRGYIPYIEVDEYINKSYHSCKTTEDVLKGRVGGGSDETIIDGLFLTEDDVNKALKIIKDNKIEVRELVIHYWRPNREYCIWNDLYRRDVNSAITIENAVIGDFRDIKKLQQKNSNIKISIERHDVVKAEAYRLFAAKHDITLNTKGEVKGDSWCTGGSWANCWGDSGTVGGDKAPEGMDVLDNLLEKVCPSISFLQYKKIMNHCVYVDDYSDGDYYGGTTYHNQYVLMMSKLYDYLVDAELIDKIE